MVADAHTSWKGKITMVKFRTRLGDLMKSRGMNRMDIVRAAGISYPTVVKWETEPLATIDAPILSALLNVLGVTYDELVYIEDTEKAT